MHSSSNLLSAGIWVYDKIANDPVLKQIRCADASNIHDTVIYQLSKSESISWFKEVLFVGCNQDTLAPLETAVIQTSERMKKQRGYKSIKDMQRNILKSIYQNGNEQTVYRITVSFDMKDDSLDTYIGRKAHIQFIDNHELIKMIMYRYSHLFDD